MFLLHFWRCIFIRRFGYLPSSLWSIPCRLRMETCQCLPLQPWSGPGALDIIHLDFSSLKASKGPTQELITGLFSLMNGEDCLFENGHSSLYHFVLDTPAPSRQRISKEEDTVPRCSWYLRPLWFRTLGPNVYKPRYIPGFDSYLVPRRGKPSFWTTFLHPVV